MSDMTGTSVGTPVEAAATGGTLLYIRTQAWKESGRSDLLGDPDADDFSDNGMNVYINRAIRRLNRELPYHKSDAWLYYTLAANETLITFRYCRSVKDVFWQDTDDYKTRYELTWYPVQVGLATEQNDYDEDDLSDEREIVFTNPHLYKGVSVDAVSDVSRRIVILASWYDEPLVNDGDYNFWTVEEEGLVIRATMLELELVDRNTQGVRDFLEPLRYDLQKIANGLISEETNQRRYLNGRVL